MPLARGDLTKENSERNAGQPPPRSEFRLRCLEATTGFEPVIGVLQTPALTTWPRRQQPEPPTPECRGTAPSLSLRPGARNPAAAFAGAEEGI